MTDTMPGRKRPWYLRLRQHLATAISVTNYAANVPDGFTRQVTATFTMDEPGKGSGPNTPQRELIARFNPADARRFGLRMITQAEHAETQNLLHADGGQYTDHQWPQDPPSSPDRRMDKEFAQQLATMAMMAAVRLSVWRSDHPSVADYRVEQALEALTRAGTLLGYLREDTDPPGDAARAELAKSRRFNEGFEDVQG